MPNGNGFCFGYLLGFFYVVIYPFPVHPSLQRIYACMRVCMRVCMRACVCDVSLKQFYVTCVFLRLAHLSAFTILGQLAMFATPLVLYLSSYMYSAASLSS